PESGEPHPAHRDDRRDERLHVRPAHAEERCRAIAAAGSRVHGVRRHVRISICGLAAVYLSVMRLLASIATAALAITAGACASDSPTAATTGDASVRVINGFNTPV